MKKSLATLSFFLAFCFFSFGQNLTISGILQDADLAPLQGVKISSLGTETTSDESGFYRLSVPQTSDAITLVFTDKNGLVTNKVVRPKGQSQISMGVIYIAENQGSTPDEPNQTPSAKDVITGEDRIPTITLSGEDDGLELGEQNISGILSASRDPFIAAAAYNLSTGGFDIRGFRSETTVLFNGVPFNNLERGSVYWSTWGGLNDVTRNRESAIDLSANANTYGGLSGYTTFDIRASKQRTQKRINYMFSNRSYSGRAMGTYSTGMQKNGWAFTFSGSKRWAEEGYVPGTFYNAYSYFVGVDKKLKENHLLNFTFLAAPIRRASQGAAIQQANDLAGTNFYNPNWGWQTKQDGSRVKRNSRVVDAHQPMAILRHDWEINDRSSISTSVGYMFGHYGRTRIDWFNAPDPRADYYRKFPVYLEVGQNAPDQALLLEEAYTQNPDLMQLQWDVFYEGNRLNGQQWENEPGKWAQVILSNQRSDGTKLNGSSTYQGLLSDHFTLNAGLTWQFEKTHYFKTVEDLLGGDFYLNADAFAVRDGLPLDFANFNLNNPDMIVRKGDTYGWDYDMNGRKVSPWVQGQFSFRKVDFFAAVNMTTTEFWRTGHFKNGRFPDNSYGDSEKQDFINFGTKAGFTYKIDGRNYFYVNGAIMNRAPVIQNAFVSARNRDEVTPNLTDEKVISYEFGYQHRSPGLKARATYYNTEISDRVRFNRFFFSGDGGTGGNNNFGAFILTGLEERHQGVELAFQAKLTPTLSANGAASIGENVYTSRADGFFVFDGNEVSNSGELQPLGTVYTKGFYIAGTPQTALSFGLEYRSPKFWSLGVTVNYFDDTYIDFNPIRRREESVFGLEDFPEVYDATINQINVYNKERIGFEVDHFSVDLFAYKSFKIKHDLFFSFTGGVTNLLNANIIQGGYEQLRSNPKAVVAATGETNYNPNKDPFAPRYFYAYGTNFFLLGTLTF